MTTNTRMGLIAGGIVLGGLTILSVALLLVTRTGSVANGGPSAGASSLFVPDSNGSIYDGTMLHVHFGGKTKEQVRKQLGEPVSIDYPRQHLGSKRLCVWTYKKFISDGSKVFVAFEVEFEYDTYNRLTYISN